MERDKQIQMLIERQTKRNTKKEKRRFWCTNFPFLHFRPQDTWSHHRYCGERESELRIHTYVVVDYSHEETNALTLGMPSNGNLNSPLQPLRFPDIAMHSKRALLAGLIHGNYRTGLWCERSMRSPFFLPQHPWEAEPRFRFSPSTIREKIGFFFFLLNSKEIDTMDTSLTHANPIRNRWTKCTCPAVSMRPPLRRRGRHLHFHFPVFFSDCEPVRRPPD